MFGPDSGCLGSFPSRKSAIAAAMISLPFASVQTRVECSLQLGCQTSFVAPLPCSGHAAADQHDPELPGAFALIALV